MTISKDAPAYYAGGHKVMMGGIPVRLARLPSGPAGREMFAQSSRDMCYPKPPRAKKDFAKWERDQLAAFNAAEKLGNRSIDDVVKPITKRPLRASTGSVERLQPVEAPATPPKAPERPAEPVVAPIRLPVRPSPYRRSGAISGAMRAISYYRVSTKRQGQSGLGLEAQRAAVEAFCAQRGCQMLGEYIEVESGKNDDRPELAKALQQARMTGATLIIAKLDRLSRNLAFLATLQDSSVKFIAVDNPEANELTIHILASVAQAERKAISARTKAALAAAKERGTRLGSPLGAKAFGDTVQKGIAASRAVREASALAFAQEVRPIIDDIRESGSTSLAQIAAELDRRGILPPRGDKWGKATLSRIIAKTDAQA